MIGRSRLKFSPTQRRQKLWGVEQRGWAWIYSRGGLGVSSRIEDWLVGMKTCWAFSRVKLDTTGCLINSGLLAPLVNLISALSPSPKLESLMNLDIVDIESYQTQKLRKYRWIPQFDPIRLLKTCLCSSNSQKLNPPSKISESLLRRNKTFERKYFGFFC